jgi:hypothetical protein
MDEKAPFKASGSKACKAGSGTKASRLRLDAHQPHSGAGAKAQLLARSVFDALRFPTSFNHLLRYEGEAACL